MGTLYVFAHQFYWAFKTIEEGRIRFRREKAAGSRLKQKTHSVREVRVPGEPDVIDSLLRATTAEEVTTICKDAFTTRRMLVAPEVEKEIRVPNWPISVASILPESLSKFAVEFIAAKNDPRFPRSSRPTNRLKQLWFLSRALAGAAHGIATRTVINLIGARRPDQMAEFSKGKRQTKKARGRHYDQQSSC